jgi:hypothetical protein
MSRLKGTTMSSFVLAGYATRYSSTQEVAEAVAATLRAFGFYPTPTGTEKFQNELAVYEGAKCGKVGAGDGHVRC